MDLLSYRTLGAEAPLSRRMPERVLQFGDGNFLRGFVDDFIDQMNEKADFDSSVVIVPPASTGKDGAYQPAGRAVSAVSAGKAQRSGSRSEKAHPVHQPSTGRVHPVAGAAGFCVQR